MTDTQDPSKCPQGDCGHIPVLVPEGKFPVDMKMKELDIASRKLGQDVLTILQDPGLDDSGRPQPSNPLRSAALVQLAWLWARRTNPEATQATYSDYEIDELNHALGRHRQEAQTEEDPSGLGDEPSESS